MRSSYRPKTRTHSAALAALCLAVAPSSAQTPPRLTGKVYFIPPLQTLPDFSRLEPVATIETNPLNVPSRSSIAGFPGIPNRHDWFAIDYQWKIYIRDPGKYSFSLTSDDGSKFYIDGKVVIDNDFGIGFWTKGASLPLSGGMHNLRLSYFQGPLNHSAIALSLLVGNPGSIAQRPFDIRDFSPPTHSENWTYGSPADFAEPLATDPNPTRVKLKDVLSKRSSAIGEFPAKPNEEEGRRFLHAVQANALQYAEQLPDFLCTEVVQDYIREMSAGVKQKDWKPQGAFTLTLTHSGQTGYRYTVTDVARKSKSEVKKISEGEFGPALASIFAPEKETVFQWDRWERFRGRLTRVYGYRTERERSQYRVAVGAKPSERKIAVTGRRGFVFLDDETRKVVRIAGESDGMPSDFPASTVSNVIDYDTRNIGVRQFLLPVRVEQLSSTAQLDFKRVIAFRDYRPAD